MHLGAGSVLIGKYRLERPLSRGGMGSVWVARHLQLGTPVAVKFMDPAYAESPAFRTRFEREARAAAQLKTPHVVQVHDFGFHESVPYLVMELLQGEDLNARLQRRGRLPLLEAHRILAQTGKALRSAHDAGLVHRDLKPANLFLARVDGEDEDMVKLLDFGIAKETTSKLVADASTTGEVMGSPHYMSPEQLRADRDLDARSDLWALGVIVFRMVTGYLPFPGDVLAHVMTRILVDPIPSATQLAPDLPPAIDAFFHRALARDRAHRFQTVREMVAEFARVAGAPAFTSSFSDAHGPFHQSPTGFVAGTATPLPGMPPGPGGTTPAAPLPPVPPPLVGPVSAGTLTGSVDVAKPSGGRRSSARTTWAIAGAAVALSGLGVTMGALYGRYAEHPSPAGAPATPELAASSPGTTGDVPPANPASPATPPSASSNAGPLIVPSAPVTDAGSGAAAESAAQELAPTRPPAAGATSAPAAGATSAPAAGPTSTPAPGPTSAPAADRSPPAAATGTQPRSRTSGDTAVPPRPPPPPSSASPRQPSGATKETKPRWGI
ncbi:protein kinase domain-containing protein [Sorangium sp. So ce1389]|uniref:serine/threonine-protein kinase n=1 Tax=Sorangium sp. So ce1389 TaxID=3133336 RepID=UPI003F61F263